MSPRFAPGGTKSGVFGGRGIVGMADYNFFNLQKFEENQML